MSHRRARTVLALALGLPLTVAMTAAATAPQAAASRPAAAAPQAAASRQAAVAPQAAASPQGDGSRRGPRYAPYFETWTKGKLPAVASASGARTLTLAFLQTPSRGSCSLTSTVA